MYFLSTILALSTTLTGALAPIQSSAQSAEKVVVASALPANVVKPAQMDNTQVLSDFDKAVEQRERRKKYHPSRDNQVVDSNKTEEKILILGGPEAFPM